MSDPFKWQLEKLPPLTKNSIQTLSSNIDIFGREFVVGDQALTVILMDTPKCCQFKHRLALLHPSNIPALERDYTFYTLKVGIPRYVRKIQ